MRDSECFTGFKLVWYIFRNDFTFYFKSLYFKFKTLLVCNVIITVFLFLTLDVL